MISQAAIQHLADEIARLFDVERIVLFGSYAYGTPTEDSDVDLLVLMEFEGRAFDQEGVISRAVPHEFPRDIIVRTPADAARRYAQFDPLIRDAINRGRPLYDRRSARVAI